jgi:hypothetical protein
MSAAATPESAPRPGSLVIVARAVVDAIRTLLPPHSSAIWRTLERLDDLRGELIRLNVPSGPPGSEWLAVVPPDDPAAPAIIYRRMPQGDGGGWRVAALMPRDDYDRYKLAEQQGIFQDPDVRIAAVTAADVAIATMGTISTFQSQQQQSAGPGAVTPPHRR